MRLYHDLIPHPLNLKPRPHCGLMLTRHGLCQQHAAFVPEAISRKLDNLPNRMELAVQEML